MTLKFKLPDLGEGVAEGEIIEWKVALGDTVGEDEPLVEVMTDKATVEIPSPRSGTIESIHFEAGAIVPVGEIIVVIAGGDASANGSEPTAAPEASAAPAPAPAVTPTPVAAPVAEAPRISDGKKPLATPATRKLARDLDIDLATVTGTGPRGRITKEDVRRFSPAPATAAAAMTPISATASNGVETTPYRGLRKKIGDQMVQSAFSAPHFTLVEEVDMTEIDALRRQAKAEAKDRGVKVTFLPFIMKALCAALKRHPSLNGVLDEAAGEIRNYADVHCGFALDTDRGLMVPVIRDAHRKNVFELAGDLGRLSTEGREGTIAREEMQGSTITITSAGSIGGLFATPIINHPELAILGVYRIEKRPVVIGDEIVVRKMMYLSITLDHRVVDGGEAARFMNTMKRLLGDPSALLLES